MVAFFVLLEDSTYFLRAFRPSSTPFLAASLASSLVFSTAASFTLLAMHFSASALLSLRILYQKSPPKSPQTGCRWTRQTDPLCPSDSDCQNFRTIGGVSILAWGIPASSHNSRESQYPANPESIPTAIPVRTSEG